MKSMCLSGRQEMVPTDPVFTVNVFEWAPGDGPHRPCIYRQCVWVGARRWSPQTLYLPSMCLSGRQEMVPTDPVFTVNVFEWAPGDGPHRPCIYRQCVWVGARRWSPQSLYLPSMCLSGRQEMVPTVPVFTVNVFEWAPGDSPHRPCIYRANEPIHPQLCLEVSVGNI